MDGGSSGSDWRWVLGIMAVAAALRLHGLTAANFWLDEANSWLVSSGSWSNLMSELRGSPVGPLYFILLKLWIVPFGDSAFSLRAFSLVPSIAVVAVVYELGVKLLSRPAALLACALIALSPVELYFAQEARMYMLTSFVALLTLWAYVGWRQRVLAAMRPSSPLVLYVLAGITLLLTHPLGGALLVAVNIDALCAWLRHRRDANATAPITRGIVVAWIAAQVAIVGTMALYVALLNLGSAASTQAWRAALGVEGALRAALLLPFNTIFGHRFYPTNFAYATGELAHGRGLLGRPLIALLAEGLTLLVFLLAADASIRARALAREIDAKSGAIGGRRLLILALVVPALFGVFISITHALEMQRYFLFVVPFWLLLLADGLVAMRPRLRNASLALLAVEMIFGIRVAKTALSRDSDYRTTAVMLLHDRRPADRVMIQPREMSGPLRFYFRSPEVPINGLAADASAGAELAKLPPGRTWLVIDYRSPLYTLAPPELAAALHAPVALDSYTGDTSVGVRLALIDTRPGVE